MYQLVESIKVFSNKLCNVSFHNERLNNARQTLLQAKDTWDLAGIVAVPPDLDPHQVYKCRVVYGEKVELVEFVPYTPRRIKYLKLVEANNIDYTFKYANRQLLDDLKKSTVTSPDTDILIVKNGFITDTSFSNIIFFDGKNWYTPSTTLLKGTKRALYLANKTILEQEITVNELKRFQKARLINAMIDMEDAPDILIENIS